MKTKAMTLRLPADVYEELRRQSFETREPMNAFIVAAVQERLVRQGLRLMQAHHKDGEPLNNDPSNLELRDAPKETGR